MIPKRWNVRPRKSLKKQSNASPVYFFSQVKRKRKITSTNDL